MDYIRYALTNNYAYLILENVYLKRDFDNKNPYDVYYDFKKKWKRLLYKYKIILHYF